jgi:hypothetical protein
MRIVPAEVELDGVMFSSEFPLAAHLQIVPPVLRTSISRGFDAAWVRARIPCLFGFTPEPSEAEKSLLFAGFIAVTSNLEDAYPFRCTDHYGKTSLLFSQVGPDLKIKGKIAANFWNALLAEPDELADFCIRIPHLGTPVILEFGCIAGEPYCIEHDSIST